MFFIQLIATIPFIVSIPMSMTAMSLKFYANRLAFGDEIATKHYDRSYATMSQLIEDIENEIEKKM